MDSRTTCRGGVNILLRLGGTWSGNSGASFCSNISMLNPKLLHSAYHVRAYVLLIVETLSLAAPLVLFDKRRLMLAQRFSFILPQRITHTLHHNTTLTHTLIHDKMLKRRKECDTYLTHVGRHRWSRQITMKGDVFGAFSQYHGLCWLKAPNTSTFIVICLRQGCLQT